MHEVTCGLVRYVETAGGPLLQRAAAIHRRQLHEIGPPHQAQLLGPQPGDRSLHVDQPLLYRVGRESVELPDLYIEHVFDNTRCHRHFKTPDRPLNRLFDRTFGAFPPAPSRHVGRVTRARVRPRPVAPSPDETDRGGRSI